MRRLPLKRVPRYGICWTKTGTLTYGQPEVRAGTAWLTRRDEDSDQRPACSEHGVEHPVLNR
jgi:cation transport ATPase